MKILHKSLLKIFVLLVFLFAIYTISALGVELYINTNPIDSIVYIDGNIVGNTPIRFKIDGRKSIYINVFKDGYKKLEKTIILDKKQVLNLHYDLVPDKIELIIKDKGKVINICGTPVGETPAVLYNVPNGMYEIIQKEKSYDINPAGYKYAIRSTVIESLYSGGMLTLFLIGMGELKNHGDEVGVTVTGFGSVVTGAILGYDLVKLFKLKINKEKAKIELKQIKYKPYDIKDDRVLFTDGVGLLGQKNYKAAIEKFSLLTKLYVDSQYVPISYYELGLCYYNLKDYSSAINVLRDFIQKYPIYEVYQYAFYYYLDSLIKLKKYERAYSNYIDYRPLIIEDESGRLYKMYFNSLIKLYKNNRIQYKEILYDIIKYADYYLKEYSNGSAYLDIMIFKAKILFKYIDRRKGLKLIEKLKQIYGNDREIMEKVESIVKK